MSEHKRRGRPRLDPAGPSTPVTLSLPAAEYSAISKVAAIRRESIGDVIRRSIRRDVEITARRHIVA